MKRLVGSDAIRSVLAGILAAAVVAATGTGAGGAYLITFSFAMMVAGIRLGPDRIRLWREKHGGGVAGRR